MSNPDFVLNQHSKDLDQFLSKEEDGVFYVGHASILVRLSGKKFLFDAVLQRAPYLESWVFFPPQVMDPRLLDVDGVFVSHCHQDHFDTDFLRQLKPGTPIYIIGGRPSFEALMQEAGLTATVIPPLSLVEILPGIQVFGVLNEHNTIDASLVIKNQNLSVYHGNDNYVSPAALAPMKKAVGDVHVGCIPFSFIHWYPFLLEGVDETWKQKEGERLINQYLDLAIEEANALGAQVVIPFGANLVYHDKADSVMNKAVLSPIDFVEYARNKLKEAGGAERFVPMFAGSLILKPSGKEMSLHYNKISKKEFLNSLQDYLMSRKSKSPLAYSKDLDVHLLGRLPEVQNRVQKRKREPIHHFVFIECSTDDKVKIQVDLENSSIQQVQAWDKSRKYHHFKVEPVALEAWLKNEMTFEEIIGTRRFRVERVPNEYNIPVLEFINNAL